MTSDTDTPSGSDISATLAQRGSVYGDFREQGRITQNLKRAMQDSPNWHKLPGYMKEGLDMIQHKVSRILNGDPLYADNIHDILGYGKLMEDRAAQDRANGVVIEGGGDVLYPAYGHEVKDPLFLKDGVRAAGMSFSRPPPKPRVELAAWAVKRLDNGESIYLYLPVNETIHMSKLSTLERYAADRATLVADLSEGRMDAYQTGQDTSKMDYHPIFIGVLTGWNKCNVMVGKG